MAVLSERTLEIYDLDQNLGAESEAASANIRNLEPTIRYELRDDDETYSRIIGVHISEKEHMEKSSWVVLESTKFSSLHFMVLGALLTDEKFDIPDSQVSDDDMEPAIEPIQQEVAEEVTDIAQDAKDNLTNEFGMHFYEFTSRTGRLIKIAELQEKTRQRLQVIFQRNGDVALVRTDL